MIRFQIAFFLCLNLILLTVFSQNRDSISASTHKMIALTASTPILINAIPNSQEKSLSLIGQELATVYLENGNCSTQIGDAKYHLVPEEYNIGISLIKNDAGAIIGMTKKYDMVHLVGIAGKIYKFEYLKSGQNILTEVSEDNQNREKPTKKMTITGLGNSMDVFHNLSSIPVAVIPIIFNTRKINKKISTKATGAALGTIAVVVLRTLILRNDLKK